eukprot:Hpha_TRINITY_DN7021_c0_g1::TRINITY_DN7021_c0_g1_i1::g.22919::m.22919
MRASLKAWLGAVQPWMRGAVTQAESSARFAAAAVPGEDTPQPPDEDDGDASTPVLTAAQPIADAATTEAMLTEAEEDCERAAAVCSQQLTEMPADAAAPAAETASEPAAVARSLPYPDLTVDQPRIGFSACLIGHQVRHNAGHCNSRTLVDCFGKVFKFVPVCPEVDIGLGVPRPTLRLVATSEAAADSIDIEDLAGSVRMWCPEEQQDLTEQMLSYSLAKTKELQRLGLDAYIFKKDSPSCGLERVKVYANFREGAAGRRNGAGLFAATLLREWPELPVADEGRLCDEDVRNNFIQSAMCHARWRQHDRSFRAVVKFHEVHKYVLMAQSPSVLKELGRELAKGPKHFRQQDVAAMYYSKFFGSMKMLVGRGRHVTVLQHLSGILRDAVDPELYRELHGSIADYKDGLVPLVVPLKLLQVLVCSINGQEEEARKELLQASEYIKGHPRSLRAHTAISSRTESKVPKIGVQA